MIILFTLIWNSIDLDWCLLISTLVFYESNAVTYKHNCIFYMYILLFTGKLSTTHNSIIQLLYESYISGFFSDNLINEIYILAYSRPWRSRLLFYFYSTRRFSSALFSSWNSETQVDNCTYHWHVWGLFVKKF